MEKASWFKLAWKSIALAASTGAALVTVFSALYSYGVIGKAESHNSIGNLGAAWVGVRPMADTASAIGDTVHYAATIADKNGSILIGAHPIWTTGDSSIAVARPDGSIIGRRQGQTTVSVVVGSLVAHARIVIRQRVATVDFPGLTTDSAVIGEGLQLSLKARALDSRGHAILGSHADWQVEDSSLASIDTGGVLSGHVAGKTTLSARIDGVTKHIPLYVVTTAANITLVAGTNQHALAGSTLPQAIVVRATNRRGAPSPGQTVRFTVPAGQGSVTPSSATTDADGRARATWTLGEFPGRQTLFAAVERVDSTLAIVAESDPVESNTRVTALTEYVVAQAGQPVADSVAVRVTDTTGRVLADVPVRWMATDGSVDEASGRTDSLGVARARWTLARKTGTQRLRAQVGGATTHAVAPVTITAKATAGAATDLLLSNGDGQRAAAGAALAKAIVLRVVDANGNGVSDARLSLSPSSGSVPDSSMRTDSTGTAKVSWTMGRSAGDYTLGVKAEGVKKLLKVAAHALPSAPANLSFDDAPAEEKHGHTKSTRRRLSAVVTDVYGNPVPDAKVAFSTKSGSVTPSRAATDAHGKAAVTWTPGSKGEQTLTGTVRGTDVKGEYSTTH